MEDKSKLVRVFAGSEITVNLLKYELEAEGIATSIVNEYEESKNKGFTTGTPYSVDLYILDTELEKAEPIVREFLLKNPMNSNEQDIQGQEKELLITPSGNGNGMKYVFLVFAVLMAVGLAFTLLRDNRQVFRDSDGTVESRGNFKNGIGVGKHTDYYENGSKQTERYYDDNGALHGTYKTWYENGQLYWIQEYEHGTMQGEYFLYDSVGNVINHEVYEKDSLVRKFK